MPLIELKPPVAACELPRLVQSFIEEADRRIELYRNQRQIPGFVPSDFPGAFSLLSLVSESDMAPGNAFCEWGSGFGVVTCLAASLDFYACGIEADEQLVDNARQLAGDFGFPVEYYCGNYLPSGSESLVDKACIATGGAFSWLNLESANTHEELGLEISDFDVVYAFPWPDEQALVADIFEQYASVNALLLTYDGIEDFRIRRKVASKSRRKS